MSSSLAIIFLDFLDSIKLHDLLTSILCQMFHFYRFLPKVERHREKENAKN